MVDDKTMEELLRAAMTVPQPEASPTFVRDVMRRTAPRRLSGSGRLVLWAYALVSVTLCVWVMRDLPVAVTAVALAVEAVVAVALRGYTGSLAQLDRR